MKIIYRAALAICCAAIFATVGIAHTTNDSGDGATTKRDDNSQSPKLGIPDISLFLEGALAEEVTTQSCVLSDGTESMCYRVTVVGRPVNNTENIEVYCPSNIEDGKEEGGLWFDGDGTVYDVSGEFISRLAEIYDDDRWKMYDPETGDVTVITGSDGCEVAGDPRGPGYDNFCLECKLADLNGGVQRTLLIPKQPKWLDTPVSNKRQNTGVAFNGVILGPPAPVDMILGSYSLGVFDDCGAHANPHDGYHYHAANGCAAVVPQTDDHPDQIGIAMDGFGIYAGLDDANSVNEVLDECGGSTDDVRGYHYHALPAGLNKIIGCLAGAQGSVEGGARPNRMPRGERGGGPSKNK